MSTSAIRLPLLFIQKLDQLQLHHPNFSTSSLLSTHALLLTSGLLHHHHPFTLSLLIAASSSSSLLPFSYSLSLLSSSPSPPSLPTLNSLIIASSSSYSQSHPIHFYKHLLFIPLSPNHITFPFLLKSSPSSYPSLGQSIHCHVIKFGFGSDIFVLNHSISMYSAWGDMASAHRLFDEHQHLVDVVSWTAMISGYVSSGQLDRARLMFDWSPCKNDVTWNAMVGGYARGGRKEEAWQLFERMPERNAASWGSLVSGFVHSGLYGEALVGFGRMVGAGVWPNEATLVSAVSACSQLRSLEQGEWVVGYIENHGLDRSLILGTALVDMYGKCGNVRRAIQVFDEMPVKNVYSWNSLIKGLAMGGSGRQALTLFWKMRLAGIRPNGITFIGLLTACSHSGLVEEGRWFFDMMTRDYKIRPLEEHYGCMVDLLARAGLMKEALDFVDGMPVEPHTALLGALANACRIHGDVELGEDVAKRLIELEPRHGGRYVLLANIYAGARRWDDMAMVRRLLKERKVVKVAGNSLVELQSAANST